MAGTPRRNPEAKYPEDCGIPSAAAHRTAARGLRATGTHGQTGSGIRYFPFSRKADAQDDRERVADALFDSFRRPHLGLHASEVFPFGFVVASKNGSKGSVLHIWGNAENRALG